MKNDFDIGNNNMKKFNIKPDSLKLISLMCLILAVIIQIIHNINIDGYIRDFIIPFILMTGGYLFLINKHKLEKNENAYILLIPIILILLSNTIIDIDLSNKVLNIIIVPILEAMFFFLLTNKNYKISKETLNWIFKLFPEDIFNNLGHVKKALNSIKHPKGKIVLNVFLGSLIGIPIALVLLFLLTSADRYFSEFTGFILEFVSNVLFTNSLFSNILFIIIIFVILFSVFINILKNENTKLKETTYNKVNSTITSTILIIINAVFVLFLISEISKVAGNFLHLPIEYTYAEYAREGFFQLLAVTTINFSILLYYIYYTKIVKNNDFIKNMLLLLIAFSILLIFNSYYRMFLYIGEYGFTVLRLQVILFLTMELILFGILMQKVIRKLKYNDAVLFTTIMLTFYILNVYFCSSDFVLLLNSI
jgi:hypothetical protein